VSRLRYILEAVQKQAAVFGDYYLNTCWSKPFLVQIEPTLRCSMDCAFCDLARDLTFPKESELTKEQWLRIVADVKHWSPLVRDIYISGGEPFLRKDMMDILDGIHALGVETRVSTIGACLTPALCDRLLRSPVKWLKFSLHACDASRHDAIVGRPVFETAVNAIKYLISRNYRGSVGILTTVHSGNSKDLVGILDLARGLGVKSVLFRPLFGTTKAVRTFGVDASQNTDYVVKDLQTLRDQVAELKQLRRRGWPVANSNQQLDMLVNHSSGVSAKAHKCKMMYESIYIRPNGSVEICGHMSLGTLGNVSRDSIEEVLGRREAYAKRHDISRHCACQGQMFVHLPLRQRARILFEKLRCEDL